MVVSKIGQRVVIKDGYIPLLAAVAKKELTKLNQFIATLVLLVYGPASQGRFFWPAIMAMCCRRGVFLHFYSDLSSARHDVALDSQRT